MSPVCHWPSGFRFSFSDCVTSTNDVARNFANRRNFGKVWFSTENQTGGRGRHGRVWESKRGDFAASLLLRDIAHSQKIIFLSFAASLAVSDVLRVCLPKSEVAIKWPNDVLVDGKKVAGILLEAQCTGAELFDWIVIGIGINVLHIPSEASLGMKVEMPWPATSIAESMAGCAQIFPPSNMWLLSKLSSFFVRYYDAWCEGMTDSLKEEWCRNAAITTGKAVRIRSAEGVVQGYFSNIDEEGALILKDIQGVEHRFTVADVYF
jgi:BirA family biotin operon repressor/biotin-[acetyl-CoA-carboxylase] ligase